MKLTELLSDIRSMMQAPHNDRRRLLRESTYTLPSSGDQACFDLYALYTLWWEDGEGKDVCGYKPDHFSVGRRSDLIGREFEDCLTVYANALIEDTRDALKDEAMQCFDEHLIDPKKILTWARQAEFVPQLRRLLAGERFGYADYMTLFGAPFWAEDADWYGGDAWVTIAEATMRLDAAFRRGNSVHLMGAVDQLLDLEHNTGNLASKLRRLPVKKQTLDLRAQFTAIEEFKPYVSSRVLRLIR